MIKRLAKRWAHHKLVALYDQAIGDKKFLASRVLSQQMRADGLRDLLAAEKRVSAEFRRERDEARAQLAELHEQNSAVDALHEAQISKKDRQIAELQLKLDRLQLIHSGGRPDLDDPGAEKRYDDGLGD